MNDMIPAIRNHLGSFLLKYDYVENDSNEVNVTKASLRYFLTFHDPVREDGPDSGPQEITVRMMLLPVTEELMIYVLAPHLLSKVLSLKLTSSRDAYIRSALLRGLIMTLFPPSSTAAALPFLPDTVLLSVSSYLTVHENIALSNTNKRLNTFILSCTLLWRTHFHRDFPALSGQSESWLEQYKVNYRMKVANVRAQRLSEREQRYRWSITPHPTFPVGDLPFVPPNPPPLPSAGDLWLPPQHLPFAQGSGDMNYSPYAERYLSHRDTWF